MADAPSTPPPTQPNTSTPFDKTENYSKAKIAADKVASPRKRRNASISEKFKEVRVTKSTVKKKSAINGTLRDNVPVPPTTTEPYKIMWANESSSMHQVVGADDIDTEKLDQNLMDYLGEGDGLVPRKEKALVDGVNFRHDRSTSRYCVDCVSIADKRYAAERKALHAKRYQLHK